MAPRTVPNLARAVVDALASRGLMIATAESCTGGLIAAALTAIPGSSAAVHGGFVTYANAAKVTMLGVPETMIEQHGAVSPQVARAMASGARSVAMVDVSIAVTGIAGPGGGSDAKPVGLVYLACATEAGVVAIERRFGDIGRDAVREATVAAALNLILESVQPEMA